MKTHDLDNLPKRRSIVLSGGLSFAIFEAASLGWAHLKPDSILADQPKAATTLVMLTILTGVFGLFFGWLFFKFNRFLVVPRLYARGVLAVLIPNVVGCLLGSKGAEDLLLAVLGAVVLGALFIWLARTLDRPNQ